MQTDKEFRIEKQKQMEKEFIKKYPKGRFGLGLRPQLAEMFVEFHRPTSHVRFKAPTVRLYLIDMPGYGIKRGTIKQCSHPGGLFKQAYYFDNKEALLKKAEKLVPIELINAFIGEVGQCGESSGL